MPRHWKTDKLIKVILKWCSVHSYEWTTTSEFWANGSLPFMVYCTRTSCKIHFKFAVCRQIHNILCHTSSKSCIMCIIYCWLSCSINKSVFSFLRHLTTWHSRICCCAPCWGAAAAAERRPTGRAAIDRYLLTSGPTAVNPQHWRAEAGWDRLTDDGPTDAQQLRYDTRCYFNVRSKADMSQLNLPHRTNKLRVAIKKN